MLGSILRKSGAGSRELQCRTLEVVFVAALRVEQLLTQQNAFSHGLGVGEP